MRSSAANLQYIFWGGNFFQHICLLLESMRRFPEQTSADGVSLPPPAPVRSSGVRKDGRHRSSFPDSVSYSVESA